MNAQIKMIGVKKKTNDKSKMARYLKQARRGMKGFALSWVDADPYEENSEISNKAVSHTNPTQKLIAEEMWRTCSHWICNTEFMWLVRMTVIYDTPQRDLNPDQFDFNFTCTLRGKKSDVLNDAMKAELIKSRKCNDSYPDGHKNKGKYLYCEFIAQIVGV